MPTRRGLSAWPGSAGEATGAPHFRSGEETGRIRAWYRRVRLVSDTTLEIADRAAGRVATDGHPESLRKVGLEPGTPFPVSPAFGCDIILTGQLDLAVAGLGTAQ
ncbi:hypothetical protein [Streptomyces sp. Ag109_O5-10]|uniref:hypothetical protein n=1 Tax=Streptomyces sp. Ag109_O5-10 TaxID=1855349 RepID=UPI00089ACBC0|nr:hypothetical protein [Streptomyces sp. Ag109_O5-10]SED58919.1 hypothetical protein SAMN05216533_0034 [Streptomyces sp. Ag109_O5-10]SEF17762.1 hypothetical protein SAMN05216533_8511 [Streptomyces sp. Ag109_O5-10]